MKIPHNIGRLEALSDGVFAFAATLMVVSLDLNESWLDMQNKGINLITFAVSFFVLIALWAVHYNYFRRSDGYVDNVIIALNSLLLFVVLYYVFPLKSLINSWLGKERITMEGLADLFQWYSLGFLLIFLCISLMYYRAFKRTKNLSRSISLLFYSRHFAIFVALAAVSILMAYLKLGVRYGVPGFIYAFLGPLCYYHAARFEKKYPNML